MDRLTRCCYATFLKCKHAGVAFACWWSTLHAAAGVAFIGMAPAFSANPAIVAGAVVSGALFGDKMSPLSGTTGIAASIVGIDLFEHISNM